MNAVKFGLTRLHLSMLAGYNGECSVWMIGVGKLVELICGNPIAVMGWVVEFLVVDF